MWETDLDIDLVLPVSRMVVSGPWLVHVWPNVLPIRLHVGYLDAIEAVGDQLRLSVGGMEVALGIADGAAAVAEVKRKLAPYTRRTPITRPQVYEDARRRLQAWAGSMQSRDQVRMQCLGGIFVGDDAVIVCGNWCRSVCIGDFSIRVTKVEKLAARNGVLELAGGSLLQAALAMLAVAATERRGSDDAAMLSRRIAEYESRYGLDQS